MNNESATGQKQFLIKGTLILSAAALITKILSAVYRVPFQNIAGDVGFYIYQQVYPFYGIAAALATQGFPVMISKYMADMEGKREKNRFNLFTLFLPIFLFCGIIFLFLFAGAGFLSEKMGDPGLVPLLKTVSFMYLFVPFLSLFRGFQQGMGNMVPTAVSQVAEQFIRVSLIIVLSSWFAAEGFSLYETGTAAIASSVIAAILALALLTWMTFRNNKTLAFLFRAVKPSFFPGRLLIQSLAVSLSGLVLILFQMSDAFQLFSLMVENGMEEHAAKLMKGVFDRGQPLIQVGLVLASSLSVSAVPAITSAKHKNPGELKQYIQLTLKIGIAIGSAAASGLFLIMQPLNTMLFENSMGTDTLRILSLSVLFASLFAAAAAVFQGSGKVYIPATGVAVGLTAKIAGNAVLIPKYGIRGAAWATVIGFSIMSIVMLLFMAKRISRRLLHPSFFVVLFVSLLNMAVGIYIFFQVLDHFVISGDRLFAAIQSIGGAILGAVIYIFTALRFGMFSEKELAFIPFAKRLTIIANQRDKRGKDSR